MVDFMTDSRRQTFRDVFVDFSVELQRLEESTPEAILSEEDGLLQCFTAVCDNMCVLGGSYGVGMRPLTDPRRLLESGFDHEQARTARRRIGQGGVRSMEPREQHLDPPAGTLQVCVAATVSVPAPPPTDIDCP